MAQAVSIRNRHPPPEIRCLHTVVQMFKGFMLNNSSKDYNLWMNCFKHLRPHLPNKAKKAY